MYNSEKTKKKQKTNMKKLFKKHNPPKNGQENTTIRSWYLSSQAKGFCDDAWYLDVNRS